MAAPAHPHTLVVARMTKPHISKARGAWYVTGADYCWGPAPQREAFAFAVLESQGIPGHCIGTREPPPENPEANTGSAWA
jgi:hypothetical protein